MKTWSVIAVGDRARRSRWHCARPPPRPEPLISDHCRQLPRRARCPVRHRLRCLSWCRAPHRCWSNCSAASPISACRRNSIPTADFYQLDLENIFYREWLFVGHSCEIAKPGDFMTMKIGAYPIIVTRGQRPSDPRLPQCLPPSRPAALHQGQGVGCQAGLPLSPMDLRSRRPPGLSRAT